MPRPRLGFGARRASTAHGDRAATDAENVDADSSARAGDVTGGRPAAGHRDAVLVVLTDRQGFFAQGVIGVTFIERTPVHVAAIGRVTALELALLGNLYDAASAALPGTARSAAGTRLTAARLTAAGLSAAGLSAARLTTARLTAACLTAACLSTAGHAAARHASTCLTTAGHAAVRHASTRLSTAAVRRTSTGDSASSVRHSGPAVCSAGRATASLTTARHSTARHSSPSGHAASGHAAAAGRTARLRSARLFPSSPAELSARAAARLSALASHRSVATAARSGRAALGSTFSVAATLAAAAAAAGLACGSRAAATRSGLHGFVAVAATGRRHCPDEEQRAERWDSSQHEPLSL